MKDASLVRRDRHDVVAACQGGIESRVLLDAGGGHPCLSRLLKVVRPAGTAAAGSKLAAGAGASASDKNVSI